MKKWIVALALIIIPAFCYGQVSGYAAFYCINPSGIAIPLLQSGTPSPTNPPGVLAYGTNSLNQAVPLQCDVNGNLVVTASGGTIAAGTVGQFAIYSGSTALSPSILPFITNQATPQTVTGGYPIINTGWLFKPPVSLPTAHTAGQAYLATATTHGYTRFNVVNENNQSTVLGRDNQFVVMNGGASPINAGQMVSITGGASDFAPTVGLAKADAIATSPADGMAYSTIGPGAYGLVIKIGIVSGLNTIAFTARQSVFLSCTASGGLTTTRPVPPCYAQKIGKVLYSSVSNGGIDVAIQPDLSNHDSGTDQSTYSLPAGGTLSSRDTGTPGFIFGTNSITANQPVTAPNPVAASSFTITAIANPSAPTVTPTCTGICLTTYTYEIVLNTLSTSITTANSGPTNASNALSLSGSNKNVITAPTCPSGVNSWDLWRLAGGTNALGKITSAQACGSNVTDTGVAGDGGTPPSTNITGGLYIPGLKAASGNYFLCINSSGVVGAFSSPCNED